MIGKLENGAVQMQFGTGDIGIQIGGFEGCGAMLFRSQHPQKVKFPDKMGTVQSGDVREYPVSMLFTNPNSIDVFIKSLQTVKLILTGQMNLSPEEDTYVSAGK
ncbi:MAG: hypothetical protein LBI03_02345 [Clostridiales bacterium]|jgi:hypothetical protein|nr:hypothetical protein [Clostridiales bacterium]